MTTTTQNNTFDIICDGCDSYAPCTYVHLDGEDYNLCEFCA